MPTPEVFIPENVSEFLANLPNIKPHGGDCPGGKPIGPKPESRPGGWVITAGCPSCNLTMAILLRGIESDKWIPEFV